MRRHHFIYATTYLRDPAIIDQMKDVFRRESCSLAEELGILREGPTSWTHPHPNRFLHADGKVLTPMYRAKRGTTRVDTSTGELREVRSDPDARLHVEGGGAHVHGNKFVLVAARNEYSRILLDIEHDAGRTGDGGEAGAALRCFDRLGPLVPGAQGVVYDQAMRGRHIDHLMRELGWLTITGVHATRDREGIDRRGS